jgi:hypothetical protein
MVSSVLGVDFAPSDAVVNCDEGNDAKVIATGH